MCAYSNNSAVSYKNMRLLPTRVTLYAFLPLIMLEVIRRIWPSAIIDARGYQNMQMLPTRVT